MMACVRLTGRLLPVAAVCAALTAGMAEEKRAIQLKLESVPTGKLVAGSSSLPLALPNQVLAEEGNVIAVEEGFNNGTATLAGRSIVFRKEVAGAGCAVNFVFPEAGLPAEGEMVLEGELLFDTKDQKGNVSVYFRDAEKNMVFYLQSGAGGALMARTGTGASQQLSTSFDMEGPVVLKIALNFAGRTASIWVNSQKVAEELPLPEAEGVKSVGINAVSGGNRRIFALKSLTLVTR